MHDSVSVNINGNDQVREVREGLSEEVVAQLRSSTVVNQMKGAPWWGYEATQFSSVQ